jgi:hypothetical protein
VQPDELDQGHDLRLRAAEADGAAAYPEAAGQNGQVDHQRRVGEGELREVDDHVGLRADRPCERSATDPLGYPVLVAAATERGSLFIERDDPRNLPKVPV